MSVGFSVVCYQGTTMEMILQVTNCQGTPELLYGVLGALGLIKPFRLTVYLPEVFRKVPNGPNEISQLVKTLRGKGVGVEKTRELIHWPGQAIVIVNNHFSGEMY